MRKIVSDTMLFFLNVFTEHRSLAAKKPMRRMLIKEYSLDSYTWQRKYAHLTSSITRAAVDEKLRRFSVSASMEEISKQANNNDNMGSQVSYVALDE